MGTFNLGIARFSVLEDERGLILGKDLGDVFEKGVVYEALIF